VPYSTPRGLRGFTLIELLVVIAIIAILAAILFPVFAQAREKARQVACLSNCKQIATGQMMYMQDYDEIVMFWRMTPATATLDEQVRGSWVNIIQPYLKNGGESPNLAAALARKEPTGSMICPSFNYDNIIKAASQPGCNPTNFINPQAVLAHYSMAMQLRNGSATAGSSQSNPYYNFPGSGWSNTNQPLLLPYADVKAPAQTANIGDGVTIIRGNGTPRMNAQFGCESAFSHQEGANYCFLDGHAKYLKGNIERHVRQDSTGRWIMTYLTFDRE